jgi:hypothetical protein
MALAKNVKMHIGRIVGVMMKVKELIEILNEQNPELTVALVCDHGQETMKLTHAGTGWVLDVDAYMMEECSVDEGEDTDDLTEIFVLEAF